MRLAEDNATQTTVVEDESVEALLGILEDKEYKEAEQLQEPVCDVLQNEKWKKHDWIRLVACRGGLDALIDHCLLQPVRQHMRCGTSTDSGMVVTL